MSKIPKSTRPETREPEKKQLQSGIWTRVVVSLRTAALEIPNKGSGCITFKNKRRHGEALCGGRCMCDAIQPHSSSGAREWICLLSWTKMNNKTNNLLCKGRQTRPHPPKNKTKQTPTNKQTKRELVVWVKYACLKRPFPSRNKHCPPSHTAAAFTWLAGE